MKSYYIKTFFRVLVMVLFVTIMPSCSSSNSNSETTNEAEKFEVGELGYLTDNCIGVVDTDDMDQVMTFLKADDMIGIRNLVSSGKATTFAAGKQVKVIEIGFEYIQVRDINASEMLVWVPKNMLTRKDLYGIYTQQDTNQ